jgi:rubrerythrin
MKRSMIIASAMFASVAFATVPLAADTLYGRDIVDSGSKVTISGTLVEEAGEWSLKTAEKTYAIHLGNYAVIYPKGLGLREGDQAAVRGFLTGQDISAIEVVSRGSTYEFRTEDGTPLWSGRGNRRNSGGAAGGSAAAGYAPALPVATAGSGDLYGSRAAAADSDRSLEEMLRYAIQDEYVARAEYRAIMAKFGEARPFANIVGSEESHIAWLKDAYGAEGLAVPADGAAPHVAVPATMKDALKAGVDAEVANIAMYDSFISSKLMAKAENADLKSLFIRLRDASKNHLAAFENGLSKY